MKRKWFIFILLLIFNGLFIYGINYANHLMFANDFMIYLNKKELKEEEEIENPKEADLDINTKYNGENIEQITKKINKVLLKTPLENKGEYIATLSLKKSVNPYLIGGIILESTTCKTDCSIIYKQCNNVSGIKGKPGCFGGTYKEYSNIDDSISDLVSYISKNFYTQEEQIPNKMFKKYGRNEVWAFKVTKYMEQFKNAK